MQIFQISRYRIQQMLYSQRLYMAVKSLSTVQADK